MADTITIHRVTIDTSSFFGLAESVEKAGQYALAAARREPGVEFVLCDTDSGEWIGTIVKLERN